MIGASVISQSSTAKKLPLLGLRSRVEGLVISPFSSIGSLSLTRRRRRTGSGVRVKNLRFKPLTENQTAMALLFPCFSRTPFERIRGLHVGVDPKPRTTNHDAPIEEGTMGLIDSGSGSN